MILADISKTKQQDKVGNPLSDSIALLLEKEQAIDELTRVVELKSGVISEQKKRILILEEALRLSKIKRFAPSSEQCHQHSLFDEAEVESSEADDSAEEDDSDAVKPTKNKKKPGRKPFSDKLPREQVFIYLTDEEKQGAIDTFFTKVKEELDIIPAKVRVLEYMQEKAVFVEQLEGETKRQVKSALMPKHPVARAMGSISLMCFVIIAKYADGLPLYRQTSILSRYGGDISRATFRHLDSVISKKTTGTLNKQ